MSAGAAIALGAGLGLALGILVSLTTAVPLAPELGIAIGSLLGWLVRRNRPVAAIGCAPWGVAAKFSARVADKK